MFGLQRIILIDGHIPNVATRINVADNANLSGTNGAGKTTILKLLPFFYGLEPGQLESRSSGRDPFVKWYLPRQTSLIIFEYTRESGTCCVVIYRHRAGEKPVYRFLESPFDEAAFSKTGVDGKLQFCTGAELSALWRNANLYASNQIENIVEYRAIIQNDRNITGRSPELRRLALRFCLGHGKTSMQHVEKVVHSLLGRHGSMEKIKIMMAEIMADEGLVFPRIGIHRENEQAIGNISTLRDFRSRMPELRRVIEDNHELGAIHQIMLGVSAGLIAHEITNNAEIANAEKNKVSMSAELESLTNAWSEKSSELNEMVNTHQAAVDHCSKELDVIQAQADGYEELNMEAQVARYESLTVFIQDAANSQNHFNVLLAEQSEIQAKFGDLRAEVNDGFQKEKTKLDDRLLNLEREEANTKQDHLKAGAKCDQDYHAAIDVLRETQRPERDELMEIIAALKAAYEQPGQLDDEKVTLAEHENAIDITTHELEQHLATLQKAEEEYRKAKLHQESSTNELNGASRACKSVGAQLEEFEGLCYPDDKSFLSALRKQDPEWGSSIGKIIRPELLNARNIRPEKVKTSGELFGWTLNLAVIETPEHARSETELQEKLATLRQRLDAVVHQQTICENALEKATSAFKSTENALEQTKRNHTKLGRQSDAARQAYKDKNTQIREAVNTRKLTAKSELDAKERDKKTLEARHGEQRQAVKHMRDAAYSELLSMQGQTLSRITSKRVEINDLGEKLREKTENRLSNIAADLSAALRNEGVDESRIAGAKSQKEAADLALKTVRNSLGLVDEYRHWKTTRLPLAKEYNLRLGDAHSSLQRTKQSIDRSKYEFKQRAGSIRTILLGIEQKTRSLREENQEIKEKVSVLGGKSHDTTPRQGSVSQLLHEAEAHLKRCQELENNVRKGIQKAESILNRSPESQIADLWRGLRERCARDRNMSEDSPFFWRNLPIALEQLIEEVIPQVERSLLAIIHSIGDQLDQVHTKLEQIKTGIQQESRRITTAIDINLCFDALKDINVKLSSRIENLEYWDDLQRFHDQWVQWKESGARELPPKDLEEAINDTLVVLKKSVGQKGDLQSLFDLEISLKENGRHATVRNDKQLEDFTSTGLHYLALCSIFIGILRQLCPDKNVLIHWPLDELGTLAPENIDLLFRMLHDNGIVIVGGFPSNDVNLLKHFTYKHSIDKDMGRVVEVELEKDELEDLMEAVAQ